MVRLCYCLHFLFNTYSWNLVLSLSIFSIDLFPAMCSPITSLVVLFMEIFLCFFLNYCLLIVSFASVLFLFQDLWLPFYYLSARLVGILSRLCLTTTNYESLQWVDISLRPERVESVISEWIVSEFDKCKSMIVLYIHSSPLLYQLYNTKTVSISVCYDLFCEEGTLVL